MFEIFYFVILITFIYALSYWIYKTYIYFPPIELEQLEDRCVIITGASRGIGEELAYEYSRYHCRLVLAARSIDQLRNVVAEKCRREGAKDVQCVQFDASSEESCVELIRKTIEFYQRIDILVLNHTASVYEHFFDSDLLTNVDNMKKLMQTNFFAYFRLAMEALPHLGKSGKIGLPSQIIAVSSMAGACPLPKTTIYGTTKHAIQGFFTNLSREFHLSEQYKNRVTSTVAILGLIATDEALSKTKSHLHVLAASVRKTAQAILAAGIYGQTRLFYPYLFALLPPLNYIFASLFERLARVGN